MRDTRQRHLYIAQALLLGIPTLAAGGTLAVVAVYVFFANNRYMGTVEGLVLLGWGLSGLSGLLGWLWLSAVYLRQGRAGLRRAGPLGWIGIALGAIGALAVMGLIGRLWWDGDWQAVIYLVAGPLLLVPSAQLVWMRRSSQRDSADAI